MVPTMSPSLQCAFLVVLFMGTNIRAEEPTASPRAVRKVVRLVVDYNDGVQKHFTAIDWRKEMTVLDALRAAAKHRRGIRISVRGKGGTAFLTEIDGLKNGGSDGRNWIYRRNNKLGDQGIGKQQLDPSDTVTWKYDDY